jgi:hypothetical protein
MRTEVNKQQEQTNIPEDVSDRTYDNLPPKDIMNAIWGTCFDYKDFDNVISDETVRDRIYDAWQRIHQCINDWIKADEKDFLDYIRKNTPDLRR